MRIPVKLANFITMGGTRMADISLHRNLHEDAFSSPFPKVYIALLGEVDDTVNKCLLFYF